MKKTFLLLVCTLSVCRSGWTEDVSFSTEQIEFFEKHIRPLFAKNCYECHGTETQEASLRVDSRPAVLKGGESGPAVVPGKVEQGELLQALAYDPDGYQMPPDGKLPQEKIDLVRQWVAMGAPWPDEAVATSEMKKDFNLAERARHWSFYPLQRPTLPAVQNTKWCRNEIDQFILQKLEEQQLAPSPEADRRTWIRRVFLDVIGLPPSLEDVDEFLADDSDEAYEKVVDRLLDSPHFGERWGRHWLDVVRYAESRGHEFDFNVANAWQFRDYIIRALNADVPFDQFVVEHVAGDLLNEKTPHPLRVADATGANESILGTGFWMLGEWVHSPVDIRQEEADRFDNMIDVYSKAFLGLTVACARCHDHKFDPIRQKDYYALQGFLQSSSYQQARFETMLHDAQIARELDELRLNAITSTRFQIVEQSRNVREQLAEYLLAAAEVLRSGPALESTTLFEGFESGNYSNWTVTGDAFGTMPQTPSTIGSYQGDVKAAGNFFVNSHQKRDGGSGDAATGTMTSREFVILHNGIQMLIGGGNHAGKTCVNLLIGGQIVRTATGNNHNQMKPERWDVRELSGQTAQIQVVDQEQEGWGNIGVDQIEFVGRHQDPQVISQVAQSKDLDEEILSAWVKHLSQLESHDPFYLFAKSCSEANFIGTTKLKDAARILLNDVEDVPENAFETEFCAEDLIPTGPGYQLQSAGSEAYLGLLDSRPLTSQQVAANDSYAWNPLWNKLQDAEFHQAEPGALENWKRSGRLLRSPTFDVVSGQIHCLVRGAVNTYVAVDSHILVKGPLHNKLTKSHPENPEWHWITHDVTGYEGHDAHLEFVPTGKAGFAIQGVVQTTDLARAKKLFAPLPWISKVIAQEVSNAEDLSLPQFAKRLGERMGSVHSSEAQDFVTQHPELFGLNSQWTRSILGKLSKGIHEERQRIISKIDFVSAAAPCLLDGSSRDEYVFIRGNWKKKGETVPRRFLEVFDAEPVASEGSGRLQLAEEMVDPEQTPILPRVIVNRIWHHYFSRGICPTPNDFGHLGQAPSHPELLDWLAQELLHHEWSLKAIHREILLSASYRMASQHSSAARPQEIDPDNVLLHRMNVKRLEGEVIRDSILTLSGSLNPQMYGPSIPIHLTDFLSGRGRPGVSGPVNGEGRRSVYLAVRRNFLEPFFQAFDFPSPHSSVGNRNVSNVPAQALALMNNPLVVEEASVWAANLLETTSSASMEQRIDILYQQAYSRSPSEQELETSKQFLKSQGEEFHLTNDDPRLWADFCHVLLNSKEFIFVR